ncbi:MAG: ATP-dependent DNA helicase RecQ [Treponema sp.]|nr:ATP-dependent DNA helicase RecQ [Treponema sp.]
MNYIQLEKESIAEEESSVEKDYVTEAAKNAFGISYLYPWQRIVISNILEPNADNNRQIVLLPTGAGKSLCFLTPALLLRGPTLVIYPLLALMADQKRRMVDGSLKCVEFRGGQSPEEREENFAGIRQGAQIIIANPEVLQSQTLVERLSQCNIQHIAIDEAHCVSEWGDSFRPSYLALGKIIDRINPPVVTAFTATASPPVLSRISEVLFHGKSHVVKSEFDRPNIHYYVRNAYAKKREAFRLAVTEQKPLIIFCGTRAKSEDMARELSEYMGHDKVRFYHAGLEREEKTTVEKWFYDKTDAVLCCTVAFGMGVDKKDIHTVIHLEPSNNAENYLQESGRAARDGSIGKGILLWSPGDSVHFSRYKEGSRERVMKEFAEAHTCRRQILLDALAGEQAACDGCDVCLNKKEADFAWDAELALKYIRHHRKMFDLRELSDKLLDLFNRHDEKEFGMHIWEASDIEQILHQLKRKRLIRTCLWPWFGKVDCSHKKQKPLPAVYYGRKWLYLQSLEIKLLRPLSLYPFLSRSSSRSS